MSPARLELIGWETLKVAQITIQYEYGLLHSIVMSYEAGGAPATRRPSI